MSTPSIKVGQGNWGIKAGNLLGYANTDKKYVARDFTVGRLLDTATRVNASGNIEVVNVNVPRIDYFGGQASLLVEPSAQNLLLRSETWNVSPWAATSGGQGSTVSGNVTTSPDGTTNADKLIEAATTGTHFCLQNLTLTSGTTYTASFFAKASERTIGRFRMAAATAYWDIDFDLTLGTATGGTNPFIQSYGNGWYRIGGTFTANQASNNFILSLRDASGNTSYTGNGTNGFFVYGAQVEASSVATSYIPTTTGSVTRNADVISVTGVAGLIGQTEGTIYAEVGYSDNSTIRHLIALSDGSSSNRIRLRITAPTTLQMERSLAGSNATMAITIPSSGIVKIALGYSSAANGFIAYVNGSQQGIIASATATFTNELTRINLGSNSDNAGQFNDRIRAVSIYQTRLPNTTTDGSPSLQSITTL